VSAEKQVVLVDHPLVRAKLTRIRDERTPSEEFRRGISELAALMAFEATRTLDTVSANVQTPVAPFTGVALARQIILIPILRAGLGMVDGMSKVLPEASVGHIGLFRDETTHRPRNYYHNLPAHLSSADVLVLDPMLATGWSATAAIELLKAQGGSRIRFVCLVSCPEGLAQLGAAHPDVPIFTAAIDERLNERAYIVPGLGDAGDRYFGTFLTGTPG